MYGWRYNHCTTCCACTEVCAPLPLCCDRECAKLTDQQQCIGHNPVRGNASVISSLLRYDLPSMNKLLPDSKCVVWS